MDLICLVFNVGNRNISVFSLIKVCFFIQESEVFIAHVVRDKMKLELTEKEIGEGSKFIWVKIDKAIELIRNSEKEIIASKYDGEKSIYHTMFIVRRDAEILKYYIKNCNIITHKLY